MKPEIGIAVIVTRGDQVLVGRRKGSHQAGKWCFPGGRLENGESILGAATRELWEETGLYVSTPRIIALANNWMPDAGVHFLTLYVQGPVLPPNTAPETKEPEKAECWGWWGQQFVPQPHMTPLTNLQALGFNGIPQGAMTPESIDFHLLR